MRAQISQWTTSSLIAMSLCGILLSQASYADLELPIVPASVMTQSASVNPPVQNNTVSTDSPTRLLMTPGVVELIPVALGHLNRIVTPFESPQVRTTSDAQTQIKGNVIYVATDKGSPVSLYITPSDQEAPALSVTLVPRRIPPREITLSIDGQQWPIKGVVNRRAATWETAQPYVDSLRDLLRRLALNQLPQGYDIRLAGQADPSPKCFQPGLKFGFNQGQIVMGHYFTVYVGLVESFADEPIEASEMACHVPDIVASAYWPHNILMPGEKTELYVVVRNHREEAAEIQRPSLLVGDESR
ncbi:type-F conjugative transfer system secretin TraK [Vibrio mimicus]